MPYNQKSTLQEVASALGNTLGGVVENSAQQAIQGVMNAQGNAVSAKSQADQGAFNQASADLANSITDNRLQNQYGYNSAMMVNANNLNQIMWDKAANWNEEMWQKQADYNAAEAQKARDWQERMSNTQYQRAMADMQAAGLNPILAYSQGGAGVPGGAAASVGGAQMSSAQAQMASGSVLGANSASESNFQGMAEWTSGIMSLFATAIMGLSSAKQAEATLSDEGLGGLVESFAEEVLGTGDVMSTNSIKYNYESAKRKVREFVMGKEASNAAYAADVAQRRGSKKK